MEGIFVIITLFTLSFYIPSYAIFSAAVLYVFLRTQSPWWLVGTGIFLDASYGFSYSLIGFSLPLYTSLGVLSLILFPLLFKRLSFS